MKKIAKLRYTHLILFLLLSLFLSILAALFIGQLAFPLADIWKLVKGSQGPDQALISQVIFGIRLPRLCLALIVGAGLALSGGVMQACIQNPLADPYLLGVSSGATAGATFSLLFGMSFLQQVGTSFYAFLGGMIATLVILRIAARAEQKQLTVIILAGVVINAICQSLTSLFIYAASNAEGVRTVNFWTMGSLANANWPTVLTLGGALLCFIGYFQRHTNSLNLLMMGQETAATLGLNTQKYQRRFMLLTAAMTAIIVSQCGIIAFVGLVVPHISRKLVGVHHRKMLPVTALLGALLLLWSDTLARSVIPNGELPIGIITSLIGAPVFMWLLINKKGSVL